MKIHFWSVGKAHESYVQQGIEQFTKRIQHYYPVEWKLITPPKNAGQLPIEELKKAEATFILNFIQHSDLLVALDERGTSISSEKFAAFIQDSANKSSKNLVFLIGGAFGLDESVIKRSNFVWSLSPLVFPHQLVRLILAEQVYRACTILKMSNITIANPIIFCSILGKKINNQYPKPACAALTFESLNNKTP